MAIKNHSDLISRLALGETEAPGDTELVHQFLVRRDEEAFAAIVRRHGGLVWGICRRVTGHHHLAEDAFQAVFMVLAARAGSIRPASVLPGWLQGVAVRTALRARTMADRRRRREATAVPDSSSQGLDPIEAAEAATILDEEIAALSEKLRTAVVLCELQGRSRKQAAGQLGISEGTLSSRLDLAKKTLAGRLQKRGIELSIAISATAVGHASLAGVPSDLIARAIAAGLTPGAVTTQIVQLLNGVIRTMLIQKLKRVFGLALLLPAVLGGILIASEYGKDDSVQVVPQQSATADPPKPEAKAAATQPPVKTEPKGPGRLIMWKKDEGKDGENTSETKLVLLSPEGKQLADAPAKHPDQAHLTFPTLSPDGKRVALIAHEFPKPGAGPRDPNSFKRHVFVRSLADNDDTARIDVCAQNISWTPEGKLVVSEVTSSKELRERAFANWLVDVEKKEKTRLDVPAATQVFALTPDGKSFVAVTYQPAEKTQQLSLIDREDKKVTPLTDVHWGPLPTAAMMEIAGPTPRLSPDGTRILFQDIDRDEKLEGADKRHYPRLFVYDLTTKKRSRLSDVPLNGVILGYAWSPDSQRVAYVWKRLEAESPLAFKLDKKGTVDPAALVETETHVIVAQADGSEPATILTVKDKASPMRPVSDLDWR